MRPQLDWADASPRAEIAQAGFREDGERELDRDLHDEGASDVRHHVLPGDAQRRMLAERACGRDVVECPDLKRHAAGERGRIPGC